ncbi:hypothetical protein EVAR_23502_1 [Eumeta japonica]|uniref:Uncharacterized protein n=1 Tax=Eumeta variegata TaxID=151549 RepID=A0A4C1W3E9_EUMVA|nr:hypothetical protein EVAR_23502_1 [Eumeta japonica]
MERLDRCSQNTKLLLTKLSWFHPDHRRADRWSLSELKQLATLLGEHVKLLVADGDITFVMTDVSKSLTCIVPVGAAYGQAAQVEIKKEASCYYEVVIEKHFMKRVPTRRIDLAARAARAAPPGRRDVMDAHLLCEMFSETTH